MIRYPVCVHPSTAASQRQSPKTTSVGSGSYLKGKDMRKVILIETSIIVDVSTVAVAEKIAGRLTEEIAETMAARGEPINTGFVLLDEDKAEITTVYPRKPEIPVSDEQDGAICDP